MLSILLVLLSVSMGVNIYYVLFKEKSQTQKDIDAKIAQYEVESKFQVDKEMYELKYQQRRALDHLETRYNERKATLQIELAKLEASTDAYKEKENSFNDRTEAKNNEISRQEKIILELIKNQPKNIVGIPVPQGNR